MKEIKFRAWDMISKTYFNLNDEMSSIPFYELFCHTPDSRALEIEQFTGLKDKNGVEIYEGDVIRCALMFDGTSVPHLGEVVLDDEYGCWSTRNLGGRTPFLKHELIAGREVIGNIHQNPELLK